MTANELIYLDHNATTPLDPRVFEAMRPFLLEHCGNAASRQHAPGRRAAEAVERARTQVADLLGSAERVVVVAGSGVDRAGANRELLQLVELLGCPVLPTMAGRSVVPRDHANYVYGYSAGGDLARREADVALVVGSRLGNLDLPYDKYWGDPDRQKIVQIDVDPRSLGVTRPLALGLVAVFLGGPGAVLFFLGLFLLRAFYFTWFEIRWNGATPGKKRVHVRVVDAHGGPLTTEALVSEVKEPKSDAPAMPDMGGMGGMGGMM